MSGCQIDGRLQQYGFALIDSVPNLWVSVPQQNFSMELAIHTDTPSGSICRHAPAMYAIIKKRVPPCCDRQWPDGASSSVYKCRRVR